MKLIITVLLEDQKDRGKVQLKVMVESQDLLHGVKKELMHNLNLIITLIKLQIIGPE